MNEEQKAAIADPPNAFNAVTMACSMREAAERYLRTAFGTCETTYMHVYEEGCELAVVGIRANSGRYEVAIRKGD